MVNLFWSTFIGMQRERKRLLLSFLSLIGGSFMAGFFVFFFFLRARQTRRLRIRAPAVNSRISIEGNEPTVRTTENAPESGVSSDSLIAKLINNEKQRVSISGSLILNESLYDNVWMWLSDHSRLYVITTVQTDEEEEDYRKKILAKLESTSFNPLFLLFCSTQSGRGHIARHLSVAAHIDESSSILAQLRPFISTLIHIDTSNEHWSA